LEVSGEVIEVAEKFIFANFYNPQIARQILQKNYGNGGRNPIGCKLRVSTTLNHRRLSVVEAGMYGFSTENEPEPDE
jgi:hypothetical protein